MVSYDELKARHTELMKALITLQKTQSDIYSKLHQGLCHPDDLTDIRKDISCVIKQLELIEWVWGGKV